VKADLIELHIVFDTEKDARHVQRIGQRIREQLQADLARRFPKQLPSVLLVDVRGFEDDPDE